jgi:hypothetical protein
VSSRLGPPGHAAAAPAQSCSVSFHGCVGVGSDGMPWLLPLFLMFNFFRAGADILTVGGGASTGAAGDSG